MADDYVKVSREELDSLRSEIADLRKNPLQELKSSNNLVEALDKLTQHVDRLASLFETANKEMYDEYSKGFHDEAVKLDKIIKQNEKIARGVIAVADLVSEDDEEEEDQGMYPLEPEVPPLPEPVQNPTPEEMPPPDLAPRKSLMREFK